VVPPDPVVRLHQLVLEVQLVRLDLVDPENLFLAVPLHPWVLADLGHLVDPAVLLYYNNMGMSNNEDKNLYFFY
jgi:hypothetical protein